MIKMNNSVADNKVVINGIAYMVPDHIAYKIVDLVSGCKVDATSKEVDQPTKKASSGKPKAYKDAGDYTVPYEVRKLSAKDWAVGFTDRVPQTAFKAVANKVGKDWDKDNRCFHFASQKEAKAFIESYPVALATDRKAVQDTYKKA